MEQNFRIGFEKIAYPQISGAFFTKKIIGLTRGGKNVVQKAATHKDYIKSLGKVYKTPAESSRLSLYAQRQMENMTSRSTYRKAGLGTKFKLPSGIRKRI